MVNLKRSQGEVSLWRLPTRDLMKAEFPSIAFSFWLLTVLVRLTDTEGPAWLSYLWKEFEIISLKKYLTLTRRKVSSACALLSGEDSFLKSHRKTFRG